MQGRTLNPGLQSCSRHFSAGSRSKGESYFRNGRVSLQGVDGGIIDAQVRGSGGNIYEVRIDAVKPRDALYVACSCPHFEGGSKCKHIWATMLAADREGWLNSLATLQQVDVIEDYSLIVGPDGEADEWDEYQDGDYFERVTSKLRKQLTGGNGRSTALSQQPPKKKVRSWHQALQAITSPPKPPTSLSLVSPQREKQVLYLLDISACVEEGKFVLDLMQQEKRKDGRWGKIKPLRMNRDRLDDIPSSEDRELLSELLGNRIGSRSRYGDSYWDDEDTGAICIGLSPTSRGLLPRICATGRFFWTLNALDLDDARTIAWDDGAVWRTRIRLTPDDKKKFWTVSGELYRNSEVRPITEVVLAADSLVLFPEQMARLEFDADRRWLTLLRCDGPVTVPYSDRKQLVESLWEGVPPEIVWPENLRPEVKPVTPRGHLKVHQPKEANYGYRANRNTLYADAEFDYDCARVKLDDPRSGIVTDDASVVTSRDADREAELIRELRELGIVPNNTPPYARQPGDVQFPLKQLDEVVVRLVASGWQVEAEGAKIRTAGKFNLSVHTSGVDWFELESQIDFGGETATLPELLAAARAGQNYVKLGDGSRGMLPEKWLARFAPLADLAEQKEGKLRFKPAQSLLLDALLSEKNAEIEIKVDQQFQKFRQKLQKFSGVKPMQAPRTFRGELRPYQETGVGWLNFLEEFGLGGCLADDMGLGKTIQVLAWLLARRKPGKKLKPTLIVVPKSLVFNWIEEAERFAPKLSTLNYTGLDRSERATDFAKCDVVLTTYGTLRRDIGKLKDQRFDCVILDEAQAIKNDISQTAKASRLLSADLRLALTGTPVENHLGELWSLFEFLNPGMLGRSSAFRNFCQQADEKPEVHEHLQRGLAPFILRRTKQQVLKELPEKTEQTIHCELSPPERKKYNELRDYYRASLQKRIDSSGIKNSKMHVLEALLRLRQAACHPGLLDKKLAGKSSAKLNMLLEQIGEITQEGHKALVFSQFTSLLSIVRQQLDKQGIVYEYLDGKTRNRQEKVDRFQTDPACPLFLISLKAGGCGLNLTAADYVFLLDPWWNPAVEAQAIDRTHRIGQTRNVFAYRLIAQDTVEEKIIELQQQKRELADAIITSNSNVLAKLTAEDLQVLLS